MSNFDIARRTIQNTVDLTRLPEVPLVQQTRVYNSAALTLTTAVSTALTFDTERYDVGGLHSTSANTSRITIALAGVYEVGGSASFDTNTTGLRGLSIRLNGTTTIALARDAPITGDETVMILSAAYRFVAGDYVELIARQTSGGNLNITVNANYSPEFWATRIG